MSAEFAKRLSSTMEGGFNSLALNLACKLKLFDCLSTVCPSEDKGKTAVEIANYMHLRERYIRELLCCLARAEFINVDSTGFKFWLPEEKSKHLVSKSPFANYLIMIPMLAQVDSQLMQCFSEDGPTGIAYSSYGQFHTLMNSLHEHLYEDHLITDLLPIIPDGIRLLNQGIKVLDLGCGVGSSLIIMSKQFPNSQFWGIDFSKEAVEMAQNKAKNAGLKNITFLEADAANLDLKWTNEFDLVMAFDAIHDQARPDLVLKVIYNVLKNGGYFYMQDVAAHSNVADNILDGVKGSSMLYTCSLYHCMPVSLYFKDGMGLGTCWGIELAKKMLKEAGFKDDPKISFPPFMKEQMVVITRKEDV